MKFLPIYLLPAVVPVIEIFMQLKMPNTALRKLRMVFIVMPGQLFSLEDLVWKPIVEARCGFGAGLALASDLLP